MIGKQIAHYRIEAKLGEGGMGEVCHARDTKLNRDVALKILPQVFAQDSQRMARFEREAQVLVSLNHASIAQIHGIEDVPGPESRVPHPRPPTVNPRARNAWFWNWYPVKHCRNRLLVVRFPSIKH